MVFDPQAESIFSKVFGRAPETSEERGFLASRGKTGGALQGALEHKQQQGGFGGQTASPQSGVSNKDPIAATIESLEKASQDMKKERAALSTEKQRNEFKSMLLGHPGLKALAEKEGELGAQAAGFDASIEGNKFDRPSTQGALKASQQGEIVRNLIASGRAQDTRREGVLTSIESARQAEEEGFDRSQQEFETIQGLLNSQIQGSQEQRAAAREPFELVEIQSRTLKNIGENDSANNVVQGDATTLSPEAQAVLQNPTLYSESGFMTPGRKEEILAELVKFGINSNQIAQLTLPTLSGKTKNDMAGLESSAQFAQNALDGLNNNSFGVGPIQSKQNKALASIGRSPAGWDEYASWLTITSAQELKAISGVQVTDQEFARLRPHLPHAEDQEQQARNKLTVLIKTLDTLREDKLAIGLKTSFQLAGGPGDDNTNLLEKSLSSQNNLDITANTETGDNLEAQRAKYNY